jgi:flagellar protein FlbD
MIHLTRLNGGEFWLNPFQFEQIDAVPDTRITMMNGHHYFVAESPEVISEAIATWMGGSRQHVVETPRGGEA